jgi:hypothetical protein
MYPCMYIFSNVDRVEPGYNEQKPRCYIIGIGFDIIYKAMESTPIQ